MQDEERLDLPSASAMEIVAMCPGQPDLKGSLPPEAFQHKAEDDEWAERGTRIHAAFETGNTFELDEEEHDTFVKGMAFTQAMLEKWMHDKALTPEEVEEGPRELRVFIHDRRTLKPIGSAKLDRHWIAKARGEVLVLDLKTGWNPNQPPARASWQGRFQSVCIWAEEYDGIKNVRFGFVKPKYECGSYDWVDYCANDLKMSFDSILYAIWQTTQPDLAVRRPGKWCGFCPCKAYCVEAGAYSMLPVVKVPFETDDGKTDTRQLSPNDLVTIWDASTTVEKIQKAVKSRLKGMPAEELAALGLEVGPGKAIDPIVLAQKYYDHLVNDLGWSPADAWKCLSFSKTDLAVVAQMNKGCSKKDAQAFIKSDSEPYVQKQTSDGSLRRL